MTLLAGGGHRTSIAAFHPKTLSEYRCRCRTMAVVVPAAARGKVGNTRSVVTFKKIPVAPGGFIHVVQRLRLTATRCVAGQTFERGPGPLGQCLPTTLSLLHRTQGYLRVRCEGRVSLETLPATRHLMLPREYVTTRRGATAVPFWAVLPGASPCANYSRCPRSHDNRSRPCVNCPVIEALIQALMTSACDSVPRSTSKYASQDILPRRAAQCLHNGFAIMVTRHLGTGEASSTATTCSRFGWRRAYFVHC